LFHLVGVYILSGNPEHVVLGDNVPVTLTCVTDDNYKLVTWIKDTMYFLCTWISKYSLLPGKVENTKIKS